MVYKLEDKKIDFNEKKKHPLLAKGKTGNVYKYGNSAIKVFHDIHELPIKEETAKYLTTIDTERILLPRKLLFYENDISDFFSGYSLKLVPKKGNIKKLINSPKKQLIENIEALEKDVKTISKKNILLSDMSPDNVQYNGNIYISDPSKYTYLDLKETSELEKLNNFQLHLLLTELFAEELRKINSSKETINMFREMFTLRDLDQNPSEFIDDIIDGQNTIKEMVKKLNR